MPTIDVNGLTIGYDVDGVGPPLILLHGATSVAMRDFAGQLPSLTRAFRCHMPDARGHGRTPWDCGVNGFDADWLVDDVLGFADAVGLATFHLLGFSMGGMTALRLAVQAPGRVRTLAVVGVSVEREPRASVVRRLLDPVRIDRTDPAWGADLAVRHDPVQGKGAWRRLLPAIAADVASQALLTPRQVRTIAPPTLVSVGDRDPFVPVDQAWRLSRSVLDGRLLVVPRAGHEAFRDQPAIAVAALEAFYRSTAEVAARRAADVRQERAPG